MLPKADAEKLTLYDTELMDADGHTYLGVFIFVILVTHNKAYSITEC